MAASILNRRDWLKLSAAGVVGYSMSGWLEALAAQAAGNPQRRKSCILLWMNGGPSQMDTFDLKPGPRQRRPVPRNANQRARHPHQRASASPRPADAGHGHRPLDDQPGRRSWPGVVPAAHRLPAAGADPVSDPRLAACRRSWAPPTRRCPTSSASPLIASSARLRTAPASSARSTPRCWSAT